MNDIIDNSYQLPQSLNVDSFKNPLPNASKAEVPTRKVLEEVIQLAEHVLKRRTQEIETEEALSEILSQEGVPLLNKPPNNECVQSDTFFYKDSIGNFSEIATEKCVRNETAQLLISGLSNKVKWLSAKIENLVSGKLEKELKGEFAKLKKKNNNKEIIDERLSQFDNFKDAKLNFLKRLLEETSLQLEHATDVIGESGAIWASTNSTRFGFRNLSDRALALMSPKNFEMKVEELTTQKIAQATAEGVLPTKEEIELLKEEARQTIVDEHEQAKARYARAYADHKENDIPLLLNSHLQTVTDNTSVTEPLSQVGRSGAISDFAHGEVSLQEMQDYSDLVALSKNVRDVTKFARLISLYNLHKEETAIDNVTQSFLGKSGNGDNIDEEKLKRVLLIIKAKIIKSYGGEKVLKNSSEEFALKNLCIGDSPLRKLLEKVNTKVLSTAETKELEHFLDDVEIDPAGLNLEVEKRAEKLTLLVLQDLSQHFNASPVNKKSAVYGRVALLDMFKNGKDESGCILNERTQGLDMLAVLNRLDGKKIKFDIEPDDALSYGGGAFIDDVGNIHMPKSAARDGTTVSILHTLFFNISVQGNTDNKGIQKVINDEGIAKLKKLNNLTNEESEELHKSFSGDKNLAARGLVNHMTKIGCASVNCYGGKDRTGVLLALLTKSALKNNFGNLYDKMVGDWKNQLTSESGVAGKIAKANANHSILKVLAPNFALYPLSNRILHLFGALLMSLQAAFLGQKFEGDAKGQLYKHKEKK